MSNPLRRDEENPFVGSYQHKHARQADLHGRAERRALAREYGMPGKNSSTKRRRKGRKR